VPLLSTKQGTDLGIALIPLAGFCKGTKVIIGNKTIQRIFNPRPTCCLLTIIFASEYVLRVNEPAKSSISGYFT